MAVPTEHRLFHVTEMLEAILAELPAKDLLLGQGVCKTWKVAIESSEKLQKALFLTPDGEGRLIINEDPKTADPSTTIPKPNLILKSMIQSMFWGCLDFDTNDKAVLPDRYSDPRGCWRRMLLTQPAATSLYIRIAWSNVLRYAYSDKVVNPRGVTMGDVLQSVERGMGARRDDERARSSYVDIGGLLSLCDKNSDG